MSKTICVLPWNHLATHPDGSVTLCCRVNYAEGKGFAEDQNNQRLNLNQNTLDEMVNSASFKADRQQMLNGQQPISCKGCYLEEKAGLKSKRQLENSNFGETYQKLLTGGESEILNGEFEFIELRLGNLCNLRCRTCNPNSSISWVKEYQKIQDELPFVTKYSSPETHWTEKESFWQDLAAKSQKAKLIYINGGEPMMIAMHWKYLRELISSGASKQITIWYNTNMTKLPDEAFEIWKGFKKVTISASIDDLDLRNNYIRYPANWADIQKNIRKFKENGISLSITQTVSAYNVYYLDEFQNWANENGLYVTHNFVFDPTFLSIGSLPKSAKLEIYTKLEKSLDKEKLHSLKYHLLETTETDRSQEFAQYTQSLDKLRKQSFASVFPEYSDLLSKHGLKI